MAFPGLSCGMQIFNLPCSWWDLFCLSCSIWDLASAPGIKPGPPELRVQSPSHWTNREVPQSVLKGEFVNNENVFSIFTYIRKVSMIIHLFIFINMSQVSTVCQPISIYSCYLVVCLIITTFLSHMNVLRIV